MIFYMSGVSNDGDAQLLTRSGITHVLADQFDIGHSHGRFPHVALDSGAFRAKRNNLTLEIADYCETALALRDSLDFVVSLDVIGNEVASYNNWCWLTASGLDCIPVWHFSSDTTYLLKYLAMTEGIIGIGGLAGTFRDRENPARPFTLRTLARLCDKYPNRFHLFGLNWVKAINELRDGLYSADSSLWLRGARYSTLLFKNRRTGKLSQAPSRLIDEWAQRKGEDVWFQRTRQSLCASNAIAIQRYCRRPRPFIIDKPKLLGFEVYPRLRPRHT